MYDLSICAIARDEQDYLEEWVAFHLAVGVRHFYIYDNGSAIPIKQTLHKYIEAGLVDVMVWKGVGQQMITTNHCLATYGKNNKWLAILDIDEFLIPQTKDTIQEVLVDYEEYGAFNVSWRIFGSNGHITQPDGYVIENYTMGSPKDWYENTHTKTIVQPARTLCAGSNPHFCQYKSPYHAVSEGYEMLTNAWTPNHSEKLQCNHYCFRSLEEAQRKIAKPRADVADPTVKGKSMEDFYRFEKECTIEDRCALRFVEKMKGMCL